MFFCNLKVILEIQFYFLIFPKPFRSLKILFIPQYIRCLLKINTYIKNQINKKKKTQTRKDNEKREKCNNLVTGMSLWNIS